MGFSLNAAARPGIPPYLLLLLLVYVCMSVNGVPVPYTWRVNGLRVSGQEEAAEEVGQKMALTSCARKNIHVWTLMGNQN